MAELVIESLEGGLSTKSPTAMLPNQCSWALNVEWYRTRCGERRLGHAVTTLDGGALDACNEIVWVHQHFPTSNLGDAQLWVLGYNGSTPVLAYKDTSWHTVTTPDAFPTTGDAKYQVNACSFHGKLFICYDSAVDRLHVFIPGATALRRTGLAEPAAAPTAADSGGAGTISDVRYYRVRYTEQVGGVTVRRSEPSDVRTHTPGGANASVTVTKPAAISEGETHWELEASDDNALWYRIATTVVGTTTYVDSTADGAGYSSQGELSEDIGDYTLIPSVRYLSVDDDRLMGAGSFEDDDLSARVLWTPVGNADGVGNDERLESDTDPSVDLDTYEGGGVTGISRNVNGYIYVFKQKAIYQGIRTRARTRAYFFVPLTKDRGALAGTIVEGIDNNGHPSLFALDIDVGPIRLGGERGGVESCGSDLVEVWRQYRTGLSFTKRTTQCAVFYPLKNQVRFHLPGTIVGLILHTQHMRITDEGFRGGWSVWFLGQGVISACLFANNIEDNTTRSTALVPFYGMGVLVHGLLWRGETGNTDGAELTPVNGGVITRRFELGSRVHEVTVKALTLSVETRSGAEIDAYIYGQRSGKPPARVVKSTVASGVPIDLSPAVGEEAEFFYNTGHGIRRRDDLGVAEISDVLIYVLSVTGVSEQWGVDTITVTYQGGQRQG